VGRALIDLAPVGTRGLEGDRTMTCPKCRANLMMADRQGIEIDYCPECRGVWLDRGELDKIIERAARFVDDGDDRSRGPERRPEHERERLYRRRKSFWAELFD
jgi:Zn-finger nucleic acid-binding protein